MKLLIGGWGGAPSRLPQKVEPHAYSPTRTYAISVSFLVHPLSVATQAYHAHQKFSDVG